MHAGTRPPPACGWPGEGGATRRGAGREACACVRAHAHMRTWVHVHMHRRVCAYARACACAHLARVDRRRRNAAGRPPRSPDVDAVDASSTTRVPEGGGRAGRQGGREVYWRERPRTRLCDEHGVETGDHDAHTRLSLSLSFTVCVCISLGTSAGRSAGVRAYVRRASERASAHVLAAHFAATSCRQRQGRGTRDQLESSVSRVQYRACTPTHSHALAHA